MVSWKSVACSKKDYHMASHRSLDDNNKIIVAALLHDLYLRHGDVFNYRAYQNTTKVVWQRLESEGTSLLTKTWPRLCKALDKALAGDAKLNATEFRFAAQPRSVLPRFLGEFFNRVLKTDGTVSQDPCPESIRVLRQILLVYYKYELPYTETQEQAVVSKFEQTENDLSTVVPVLEALGLHIDNISSAQHSRLYQWRGLQSPRHKDDIFHNPLLDGSFSLVRSKVCDGVPRMVRHCMASADPVSETSSGRRIQSPEPCMVRECDRAVERIVREARILLSELFAFFEPQDINPRHGPGVVATKQRLWDKYRWTNVSQRIRRVYPLDEYFYSSLAHVSDRYDSFSAVGIRDLSARVILVPKDSRGPRLISCEPVDFQWVQQGLSRAIVRLVESSEITRYSVHFTDQRPNQIGALWGSQTGRYATLDLNEASDRVSVGLVRLLFPPPLVEYLEACRTVSTELPNGRILPLLKFAPMGSALCFPILALTVWSILAAVAPDQDTRDSILVYGDDVIVPTAYAAEAIERLELFGLKVNRDKSCTSGFFRESCGTDAYKGKDVTPVRLRTVWSSLPSPDVYTSWIAYANSFYDRSYFTTYDLIVGMLHAVYGELPDCRLGDKPSYHHHEHWKAAEDESPQEQPFPCLYEVPDEWAPKRYRINHNLQKKEWSVWVVKAPRIKHFSDGWEMLLRYFSEAANTRNSKEFSPPSLVDNVGQDNHWDRWKALSPIVPFRVGTYTQRGTSMLVKRWR